MFLLPGHQRPVLRHRSLGRRTSACAARTCTSTSSARSRSACRCWRCCSPPTSRRSCAAPGHPDHRAGRAARQRALRRDHLPRRVRPRPRLGPGHHRGPARPQRLAGLPGARLHRAGPGLARALPGRPSRAAGRLPRVRAADLRPAVPGPAALPAAAPYQPGTDEYLDVGRPVPADDRLAGGARRRRGRRRWWSTTAGDQTMRFSPLRARPAGTGSGQAARRDAGAADPRPPTPAAGASTGRHQAVPCQPSRASDSGTRLPTPAAGRRPRVAAHRGGEHGDACVPAAGGRRSASLVPDGLDGRVAGISSAAVRRALRRARDGQTLDVTEAAVLLPPAGDALDELLAAAGAVRDAGLRLGRPARRRHVLEEGLHPADPAVPGPVPLLHVRHRAAPAAGRLPGPRRGARDRPRRRRAGLQGGAVHPRRPAGGALAGGPGVAGRARATTPPWTTCGRARSRCWRRPACCRTSTRACCPGRSCSGCSRSRRAWA